MADEAELKVGGFTFKGVYLAAAIPLFGSLSGGIYYGYDVVNRFWGVEEAVVETLDAISRIQALEQTIGDNNVSGLNTQLSQISTQMVTILEQQKALLDLRSKVERAELITNGIDDKLKQLKADLDSTWDAIDELGKPL
jgi:succinate dehydrogenase/fumarate reductase flavoprotein subunit